VGLFLIPMRDIYDLKEKIDSELLIPELKTIVNNPDESKGNIKSAKKDLRID
jgi:hypothetical protein